MTTETQGTAPKTAHAVVVPEPGRIERREVGLLAMRPGDIAVENEVSGISTGTEKLLWEGRMPTFPGLGYPLVPGYESVGRIVARGADVELPIGTRVFVPGTTRYADGVRGLFGATASHGVLAGDRAVPVGDMPANEAALVALAATAMHALAAPNGVAGSGVSRETLASQAPELVVGHGVLGRLLARLCIAIGARPPMVWEREGARRDGADGYRVSSAADDDRHDYTRIVDVSGDATLLDRLIARLARGGRITLAGFYAAPLQFEYPAAFMREVRFEIAAEWTRADVDLVLELVRAGQLSLAGLVSHEYPVSETDQAYPSAFEDAGCLKTILHWSAA